MVMIANGHLYNSDVGHLYLTIRGIHILNRIIRMSLSYMATLVALAIGLNKFYRSLGIVYFICQKFAIFIPAEAISALNCLH